MAIEDVPVVDTPYHSSSIGEVVRSQDNGGTALQTLEVCDQLWHPNLGVNNHITLDMANLTNALPYTGHFARDHGFYFEFHPFHYFVNDIQTGKTLLVGHMHDGLYRFDNSRATSSHLLMFED
ncbi:hypothetical protein J1N35_005145 [Gossypium stocksii]|uniref:Uncharacterized protein n=1 Tax=Gossypium stocksii TaxID=47602 RepID=A0A9D4AIZ9_9ROSI|nr:hypothetical protein J1N35_005145 [Gossypium stocksii]